MKNNLNIMIGIGIFLVVIVLLNFSNLISTTYVNNLPLDNNGVLETQEQDYNGEIVSFFITKELAKTTLNNNALVHTNYIIVSDSTGCLVGDALDLYDNDSYFQGLISAVNGNNITIIPDLDRNWSVANTEVKCGEWNMNVDGSVNTQEFYINPPKNASWDIESIGMKFSDNLDWDISRFGSLPALTNGFTINVQDGTYKELFLVYDNSGFTLRGGVIQRFEKAPSGEYGFTVDMEFEEKYGSILALHPNDKLIAKVNDDLTNQEEIAFIVRGHYKDD